MYLEEILKQYRSNPDLFNIRRKIWHNSTKVNPYASIATLTIKDILADDWVIEYSDDSNARL